MTASLSIIWKVTFAWWSTLGFKVAAIYTSGKKKKKRIAKKKHKAEGMFSQRYSIQVHHQVKNAKILRGVLKAER